MHRAAKVIQDIYYIVLHKGFRHVIEKLDRIDDETMLIHVATPEKKSSRSNKAFRNSGSIKVSLTGEPMLFWPRHITTACKPCCFLVAECCSKQGTYLCFPDYVSIPVGIPSLCLAASSFQPQKKKEANSKCSIQITFSSIVLRLDPYRRMLLWKWRLTQ